jgi:hypothetical protein
VAGPSGAQRFRATVSRRVDALPRGPHDGNMAGALAELVSLWESSAERFRVRCEGLSDSEFFWEPVADCWSVRRDLRDPLRWTYEYDFDPPHPHPVTTIAWRLVHVSASNWIYWEHAFGDGARTFADLDVPHSAGTALTDWLHSRRPISRWLRSATDQSLDEPRPSHLGPAKTAGEVVRILLDEQIHHSAEIGLMRDLYGRVGPRTGFGA